MSLRRPAPLSASSAPGLLSLGLAALLAASACKSTARTGASTSQGTTGATASSSGSGGAATITTAGQGGFCAPETVDAAPSGPHAFTVKTAHYQLQAEAAEDRAVEMGRLLEAAFPAFQAWFQAAPPPAAGRLQVKVFADEAAFVSGLADDGIAAPPEAGGYFSPTTRTAYLFAQGNPYYTHVLLLHEATHQFHQLSRTKGRELPYWYSEGQAEHLGRHDWDGHCVRLGVVPLLTWENLPASALAESRSPGVDVAAVVGGAAEPSRAAAWALFRFLDAGPHHDAFKAFRAAFDAGQTDPAHAFSTLVADPASLSAPLAAWLAGAQEPMRPVFTEWLHRGPHALSGESPGRVSLAVVKAPVMHFEARYTVPSASSWSAGVVLGYQDDDDYQALLVSQDRRVRTFTASAGTTRWHDAGTAPADSGGGAGTLAVDYLPGGVVRATVNGAVLTRPLGGLPPVAGLAISDSRIAFDGVVWK